MRQLNLILFNSSLSSHNNCLSIHRELLDKIQALYDVRLIWHEDLAGSDYSDAPTMLFIGSGGVEELVKANRDLLPSYLLMIADGLSNSLAASLEILSWTRLEGGSGRVLHGTDDFILQGISDFTVAAAALGRLQGKRLGVIGKPSGWLIASGVEYGTVKQRWGVEIIDLPLDEVISRFGKISDASVEEESARFVAKATAMREPTLAEMIKAARLYRAVKGMVDDYNLDAFTLNCFDLIPPTRTTGCLALALLNEEGVPAGCEGDLQTILTMMAVSAVTGQPSFMANPSKILNNATHEIILAHCTIAPSMTHQFEIRTHFESQSGVAIDGTLEPGDMTIVKCGGHNMERFFITGAQLLENLHHESMCRTQLHLRLDKSLDYFLERSIGNHHVIVSGNHVPALTSLFRLLGAREA